MCMEPLRGVREKLSGDTTSEYRRGYQQGVRDSFKKFKSAVDFYLKYLHCNFNLDELKHIMPEDVQTQYELYNTEYVDDWLFRYCFGDVIDE